MSDGSFEQMGELAKVVERAAEFGRRVMRENDGLKKELRALKQQVARTSQAESAGRPPQEVSTDSCDVMEERKALRDENQELADHCARLETENENLLNFYVASHELHSTLKIDEVLSTIREIVINLIGADRFGIYLASEKGGTLGCSVAEGMELSDLPDISLKDDPLGHSLVEGSVLIAEEIDHDKTELIAGVPLAAEGGLLGAILVYGLLEHKSDGFGELDHGLFALLAQHAGTSLLAARLFPSSERKRETFEAATRLMLEEQPTRGS